MKNSECTIYILSKDKRTQKVPKGRGRLERIQPKRHSSNMQAEQFISHILPPLAGIKGSNITVKVEPDQK
ncbi:MAG: hypothetical protein ACLQO7_09475 [Candidatus Bathyarchaeia archaeon]